MTPIRTRNHQIFCRSTISYAFKQNVHVADALRHDLPRNGARLPIYFKDLAHRSRLPVRYAIQSFFHYG